MTDAARRQPHRLGLGTRLDPHVTGRCWTPTSRHRPSGRPSGAAAPLPEQRRRQRRRPRRSDRARPTVEIDLDAAPADTSDAYLRLHLLSHRLVTPRTHQPRRHLRRNCRTWSGPRPARAPSRASRRCVRGSGRRRATSPCSASTSSRGWSTTSLPTGVRIADADRVRLGAHLAEGTTVMHEGFVNFNAGTLGTSMVEGRISAGVVVGDGSDVGGGASIMGTLSGGGKEVISIGERCLLGRQRAASASRSATTASSRPGSTSPPAPRSRCRTAGRQGRWSCPASRACSSCRNSVTGAVEARRRAGHGRRAQRGAARQLRWRRFVLWRCTDRRLPRRRVAARGRARHRARSGGCRNRGLADPVPGQQRCVATRQRPVGRARPGPGPLRLDHRRPVGQARPAAAGRVDRDGDRLPGDRDPQPGLRRPRLGRTVPAASVPGLGHREAADGPVLRDRQVLRRPGQGRRTGGPRTSTTSRRRCSAAATRGLPRSRGRCPGAGQRPHRPLPRRIQLSRPDRCRRRPRGLAGRL